MKQDKIPLTGGNVNAEVVRVGDTVRRAAGPWTPTVHALLEHLHAVGFRGAPRPLGIDEKGREVLTFAAGELPWPDHFHLVEPGDRLARVARLIRDLHDAAASFVAPPDARWNVPIRPDGEELITHHDLAPWNLVIGADWVFIDWDGAGPGSRLWDVAYAIHGFVPMSAGPQWQRTDAAARLRVFADAYALDEGQRHRLVPMLAARTRSMHTSSVTRPPSAPSRGRRTGAPGTGTCGAATPTTSRHARRSDGRAARVEAGDVTLHDHD